MKWLRIYFLPLPLLLCPMLARAQVAPVSGFCVNGAKPAVTSGLPSSNLNQNLISKCTVTVFLSGTTTKAAIYDKNLTPLSNPFTANTDASWTFYAGPGTYDATLSGGIAPNTYSAPRTVVGLSLSSGGGGGGNCGPLAADPTSTNCGSNNLAAPTGTQLQAYGSNNLNNINATEVVAMGDTNANGTPDSSVFDLIAIGDANVADFAGSATGVIAVGSNNGQQITADSSVFDLFAIGDSNGQNLSGSASNVIGFGRENGQNLSGSITDLFAIGDGNGQNLSGNATNVLGVGRENGQQLEAGSSINDLVAIGDSNGQNLSGSASNVIGIGFDNGQHLEAGSSVSDLLAIGDSNGQHLEANSSVFNLVAIGVANGQQIAAGSSISDLFAIGDGNGQNLSGSIFSVIGLGDGNVSNLLGGSANGIQFVVGVGSGASSNYGDGTSDVVGIGNGAASGAVVGGQPVASLHDVIGIGDGAAGNANASEVVAIGDSALLGNYHGESSTGNAGQDVVAIGDHALVANSTGTNNVAIGTFSGAVGWTTDSTNGNANLTGSQNTWLGDFSGPNVSDQLSNTVAIGYQAQVSQPNQVNIGNDSITQTRLHGLVNNALFTPASSSDACATGDTAHDANFLYVCTATNHWRRSALGDF